MGFGNLPLWWSHYCYGQLSLSLTFGSSYIVVGNLEFPATFFKINCITFLGIQYQDVKNTAVLGVLKIRYQDVKNTAVLGVLSVLRIQNQDAKNTAVLGILIVLRIQNQDVKNTAVLGVLSVLRMQHQDVKTLLY